MKSPNDICAINNTQDYGYMLNDLVINHGLGNDILRLWYDYTVQNTEVKSHPWYADIMDGVEHYFVTGNTAPIVNYTNGVKMRSYIQSTYALILPRKIIVGEPQMEYMYTGYQIPYDQAKNDLLAFFKKYETKVC